MIIPNKLNITYKVVTPRGESYLGNTESNVVNTEILSYSVSKAIVSDKTCVKEGGTVRNTVTITNNSATKLLNNFFTVSEPDGASYIAGSVKINGVKQPSYGPITGFPLPELNPGESVVIEFDLKADRPVTYFGTLKYTVNDAVRGNVNYSENTNTLSVEVVSNKISVIKRVDKAFAVKGEKLRYTVIIANNGNTAKTDIMFKDAIPAGTTFVSNSVKLNGASFSAYNPEDGFAIPGLAPGEVLTVEFDVKVN